MGSGVRTTLDLLLLHFQGLHSCLIYTELQLNFPRHLSSLTPSKFTITSGAGARIRHQLLASTPRLLPSYQPRTWFPHCNSHTAQRRTDFTPPHWPWVLICIRFNDWFRDCRPKPLSTQHALPQSPTCKQKKASWGQSPHSKEFGTERIKAVPDNT